MNTLIVLQWSVVLHADSFCGNIRPEDQFLGEVVVQRDDALLSIDEQVVVARVEPQFTQVVAVRKQQKRLLTCKQTEQSTICK